MKDRGHWWGGDGYSYTSTGKKAHILEDGALNGSMKTLCGIEAHSPISASEKEISKAENHLCRKCKEIRKKLED